MYSRFNQYISKKKGVKKSISKFLIFSMIASISSNVAVFAEENDDNVTVTKDGNNIILENDYFHVEVGEYGQITSLQIVGDLYPTNYVMNAENSPNQDTDDHQWMGELMFQSKLEGEENWTESWTNSSASGRNIELKDNKVIVTYDKANEEKGINDFKLVETYSLIDDKLNWEITVTNTNEKQLEIGDFGVPLAFNEIWPGNEEIYETRVVDHSFVSKESSYVYATRPSGQGQYLLLTPDESTEAGFEYQDHWRVEERGQTNWAQDQAGWANGLNVFYIHSNVIKSTNRGYLENTSLILAPGESKSYGFNFTAVDDEADMRSTLYDEGIIDAVALPSMIFSTDMSAKLDLHAKYTEEQIEDITIECPHEINIHDGANNCTAEDIPCNKEQGTYIKFLEEKVIDGEKHKIYEIKLSCLGQNNVHITYDGGKEAILQFYAIAPISDALETHSDFMVEKTQWDAEGEIYDKVFDDWMMDTKAKRGEFNGYWGWGDDWGLTHGEFIAEKNVYRPVAEQISAVDQYLDTAIWNGLMAEHQDDYLIHDFLMDEPNSTPTYRGYAYPHIYNTYFAMYKIAKKYPEIINYTESAETYLLRCYNIMKALYSDGVAYNWSTGLMGEQTTPYIIAALEEEGLYSEAETITEIMGRKYDNFKNTKYPYGSEYSYDNTGEEAVYTLAKMNNNIEMMSKIDLKTRACRGLQPIWYHYGNPTTICGENWFNFQYTASLAGYCMDDYLRNEENSMTEEERAYAERVNYAGKIANLTAINSGQICADEENIGAVAWTYQAELGNLGAQGTGGGNLHNGWRQMSGEADLGLYGALNILSADVATDPVFGLFGYGCEVSLDDSNYTVIPKDGLYTRLNFIDEEIYIEFDRDQYSKAVVNKNGERLEFNITNLSKTEHNSDITISGLKAGSYELKINGNYVSTFNSVDGKDLIVSVPLNTSDALITIEQGETPENTAPKVDAGANSTCLRSTGFTLKGSASDDGYPNQTLSYKWEVVSTPEGGKATLENPDKVITKGKVSKAGTYDFKLTVSDGELESSDTVSVVVEEDPPLAEVLLDYSFDNIEGDTVLDEATEGNNGTIVARREIVEGKVGKAIKFNGKAGYVELPKDINKRVEDVTISAYVNLNDVPVSGARLIELGNVDGEKFSISFVEDGKVAVSIPNLSEGEDYLIISDFAIAPGYYKNITFKMEDTKAMLFIDGVLAGSLDGIEFNLDDLGSTSRNYLGKSQSAGVTLFNGIIDEFIIYSKALSDKEIYDSYYEENDIVIDSAESIKAITYLNVKPNLPKKVKGILSNGTYGESDVTWDEISEDLYASTGSFKVYGSIEGSNIKAIADITVISEKDNPYLTAHYSFDNVTDGQIEDLSGKNHNATLNGSNAEDTLLVGRFNNGILMNRENNNFISVENAGTDFASSNLTVSYWMNRQKELNGEAIIAWTKGDWSSTGWYINATSDTPVGIWLDGGSNGFYVESSAAEFYPENQWVLVTITWNSDTKQGAIYRNGVKQEITISGNPSSINAPSTEEVLISKNYYGTIMNEFALDDLRVYNTDLKEDYIAGIYDHEIVALHSDSVWTKPGEAPLLPQTITAIYSDYTDENVEVTWNDIDSDQYVSTGEFTVFGLVEGTSIKAECKVIVSEKEPSKPVIVSFEESEVETEKGIKPVLPSKVTAKLSDGTIARYDVLWDEIAEEQYAQAGEFRVYGSVEGTEIKAICNVTVISNEEDVERANIASAAIPTAKYTNNDLGGITTINDGFDPASSNDKSHGLWHNWGEEGQDEWLQYSWNEAVTIDCTDVYYFTDFGGINMPGAVDFQYLDEDSNWQYVKNAEGLSCEADKYNRTTFEKVTTTAIRMNLSPSNLGLGVIEWKVYEAPKEEIKVVSIEESEVTTKALIAPVMPTIVKAVYSDNTTKELEVVWDEIDEESYGKAGIFKVEGTVEGTDMKAICNVTVEANKVAEAIEDINNSYVAEIKHNKLIMPVVSEGLLISIKSSSNEEIIDTEGNITRPKRDTEVEIIFTVSDGEISMESNPITVLVKGDRGISQVISIIHSVIREIIDKIINGWGK